MLPWQAVERLRDHCGDYLVVVRCGACRHQREVTPAFLARLTPRGWDELLANLVVRFRCRCGAKQVDVQIAFDRKPRGWVKNPS